MQVGEIRLNVDVYATQAVGQELNYFDLQSYLENDVGRKWQVFENKTRKIYHSPPVDNKSRRKEDLQKEVLAEYTMGGQQIVSLLQAQKNNYSAKNWFSSVL